MSLSWRGRKPGLYLSGALRSRRGRSRLKGVGRRLAAAAAAAAFLLFFGVVPLLGGWGVGGDFLGDDEDDGLMDGSV